jgi:hypothetical protein
MVDLIRRDRLGEWWILESTYGAKMAAIGLIALRAMFAAGQAALYAKRGSLRRVTDEFLSDAYAYDQAIWAAEEVLKGFAPAGEPAFRREGPAPYGIAVRPEVVGADIAAGILYSLAHPDLEGASDSAGTFEARAFAVKMLEKLGDDVRITVPQVKREDGHRRVEELRARSATAAPQAVATEQKTDARRRRTKKEER